MSELVFVSGNQTKTTSLKVAEYFKKRHSDVLDRINKLNCSPEFTERNFTLSEYKDESGKTNKMFELTKDGFVFLTMGFTGKKAAKFKEDYIAAFNTMEAKLKEPQNKPVNQLEFLQGLLDTLKSQDQRLTAVEKRVEEVAQKPTQLFLEVKSVKQYKTFKKELNMEKWRRPLNQLVHAKFIDMAAENRWRFARKLYKQDTGWDFASVDSANEDQFNHFYNWLLNHS